MLTKFVRHSNGFSASNENGAALLLYAIFLSLIAGLGAYGYLETQKTMDQANPEMLLVNRAQAAAYSGVQAIQTYYDEQLPGCSVALASGGTCPAFSGSQATANTQSVLYGTPVSLTAQTISNTLNGIGGSLIVNSTGNADAAQQTLQAVLTTSLQTLNGGNANFYLNGNNTINGKIKNNTGAPIIIVGTTNTNPGSSIIFHGTTVQFEQLQIFPDINPQGLEQYSSMELTQGNVSPTLTIPASAIGLYDSIFQVSLPSGGYTCTPGLVATGHGHNAGSSASCGILSGSDVPYYDSSAGEWEVSSNLPGIIYSDGNVTVNGAGNNAQLTVAAEGTISTTGNGTIYNPFANTSSGLTNYCQEYPSLSACEPDTTPSQPYYYLTGVTFVTAGDITLGGNNESINGDIATLGSLLLNGGGNKSFGGVILAQNGLGGSSAGSTVNGSITLNQTISGSHHATFGGLQMNIANIRWITQ